MFIAWELEKFNTCCLANIHLKRCAYTGRFRLSVDKNNKVYDNLVDPSQVGDLVPDFFDSALWILTRLRCGINKQSST